MSDLDILIVAPTGRDASLICDVLQQEGQSCRNLPDFASLLAELGEGLSSGSVLITEEAISPGGAERLARRLRNQPTWSNLPVLVLGREDTPPDWLGPLLSLQGVELLQRPLHPSTLSVAALTAVEHRNRQYEVRDLLTESARLNQQLQERARQLRRLSSELADTEERERRRLAEYVHDDLQQILVGMNFHFDILARRINENPELREALEDGIATLRELLGESIAGTRRLSQELSPTALRKGGLAAALKWLGEHVGGLHNLSVELEAEDLVQTDIDQSTEVLLFRAAQELLLNVAKHADTDHAKLRYRRSDHELVLQVEDQGKGFEAAGYADFRDLGTFGLFSIGERVEILGGTLEIEAESGKGCRVTVTMPQPGASAAPAGNTSADGAESTDTLRHRASGSRDDRIRVVLVDDHSVLRTGLRKLLEEDGRIHVVDELDGGQQAVDAADRLQPDVIVMDVAMPGMDGIEATRRIRARHPAIRVIGLSMFEDDATAQRMLEAGAERYLTKTGHSEQLLSAVLDEVH